MSLARRALERLYVDSCTIYTNELVTDAKTHVTKSQRVMSVEAEPCRVSFSSFPDTGKSRTADSLAQAVRLFISPEVVIPAGSRIEITRNGKTTAYKRSGEPAMYPTHQEINLELEKEHP